MSKVSFKVCLTPNNYKKLFNSQGVYSVDLVLEGYIQNHKRAVLTVEDMPEPKIEITESELREVLTCFNIDRAITKLFKEVKGE